MRDQRNLSDAFGRTPYYELGYPLGLGPLQTALSTVGATLRTLSAALTVSRSGCSAPALGDRGKHCGIRRGVARLLWEPEVASSILATPTTTFFVPSKRLSRQIGDQSLAAIKAASLIHVSYASLR